LLNPPPTVKLSSLNIDIQTLQAIENLLSYIEPSIASNQTAVQTYILNLKNDIAQLKVKGHKSGTGMVHASRDNLRQAFHRHHCAFQSTTDACSYLLLFYAVECGLKSIWLKQKNLTGTDRIQDQTLLSKDGHNFAVWIKEIRLPKSVVGELFNNKGNPLPLQTPTFRLASGGAHLDTGKAHQVWRYGIPVDSQDQKALVEWLEKVCIWIKENINR
jgi:hypothetical protein